MLAVLAAVAVAAQRLKLAPSILLVVAGIGMALIPGLPQIQLAPELVLLVILPPLIYSAGVSMSWREFRFNLRPITLLAFGCVVFTTCAVAAAAHYLLNFDWAIGFVLGAIVAPPDVVAPLAIARRLALPRRLLVVLEGEGLANDATALVLYRFAVAAAVTGTFSLSKAAGTFSLIVVGEIIYWHRRRLAELAAQAMGSRAARRNHAVADDTLSRVLGAGASRRVGRAGDRRMRPVCELERAAFDFVRHASAGHLFLGLAGLSCRRPGVPADGIGSARVIGAGPWLSDPRIARLRRL